MMTYVARLAAFDPFGLRRRKPQTTKVEPMAMHHLRRIKACREKMNEAREARDEAIREAWAQGETMRDISKYAGMSHQRVQQIIKRR